MKKIIKIAFAFIASFLFFSCSKNNIVEENDDHIYGEWIDEIKATCDHDGLQGHYHCEDCGKDFNEFFEEIEGGAQILKGGHDLIHNLQKDSTGFKTGKKENYLCKICGKYFAEKECITEYSSEELVIPCKTLSVKEFKDSQIYDETATIRATVIGATGNTDGGHIYYVLKDEISNDQILMRSFKEQDFKGSDTEELSCTKGYSYSPSMLFKVGDIIEAPVKLANNGGTLLGSGGGCGQDILLWQGEDYIAANAKEDIASWNARYIVGTTENYAIDKTKVTVTVKNQEDLNKLLSAPGFQNYTVCFEGTDANPIKFVTGCRDGVEDINREYLYFFYDNATSLDDCKVGNANPVFSNFGNTFSMYSPLSTLLCDQRQYEAPNFNNPYEFVGKIYATCVGGNSSYYHFVCMSENDIININNTGSHAVIQQKMAKNVFFDFMEEKLAELGVNIGGPVFTAIGTSYVINPMDFCKILSWSYKTPSLQQFYGDYEQEVTILKKGKDVADVKTILNGPLNDANYKKYITDKYEPIGTKGGSLAGTTEERPYEVMNNVSIVKGPNNTIMLACVCMHRADSADTSEKPYYNCYQEMGKVFDILVKKNNGMDTKALEESLLCYSCAGVMLPADGSYELGYDFFKSDSKYIHFASQKAEQKIVTASCWKMFTSTCFLNIVPEADLDIIATFGTTEENSMVNKAPDLVGGDKLSFRDAIYITLLPSSNDTPSFLARYGGEYLIRRMFPLEG